MWTIKRDFNVILVRIFFVDVALATKLENGFPDSINIIPDSMKDFHLSSYPFLNLSEFHAIFGFTYFTNRGRKNDNDNNKQTYGFEMEVKE